MSDGMVIDAVMLEQGYVRFNGVVGEHHEFEVIRHLPDGTFLVRDPYEDMLQHWAITEDEVEVEEAQGSTTPIPWTRTRG